MKGDQTCSQQAYVTARARKSSKKIPCIRSQSSPFANAHTPVAMKRPTGGPFANDITRKNTIPADKAKEDLTMDDFIYYFGQLYEQILNRRRNEDYEINPVQMDHFLSLLHFFQSKVIPEYDDGIEPFHLEAKEECGGFSADFCVFDIHGDEVQEFSRLISCCSAVSIDAKTNSQICISLTVPDIFTLKAGIEESYDFDDPEFPDPLDEEANK